MNRAPWELAILPNDSASLRRSVGVLLCVLILGTLTWTSAAGAAPLASTAPSTQPTITYDKFDDRTTVLVNLGGLVIGYTYPGKEQKGWHDELRLVLSRGVSVHGDSLIVLVDATKRVRLDVGQDRAATITSEWLAQLAGAHAVELNIGDSPDGVTLSSVQIQSIKSLLDQAGYYSDARRKAEEERKLVWVPGKRVTYIIDPRGRMMQELDSVRTLFAANVLDHPDPGVEEELELPGGGKYGPQEARTVELTMRPLSKAYWVPKAKAVLAAVVPRGLCDLSAAFDRAIRSKPDAIVFLTANSSAGLEDETEMPGVKAKLLASGIPLNVLVFSAEDDPRYEALAKATKGLYRKVQADR